MKVYNAIGQKVGTLAGGTMAAGGDSARFHASTHPSGMYFYRLETSAISSTQRMLLLK